VAVLKEELRAAGLAAGLDVVRVAGAEPFESTRVDLERRREQGLHGGMAFTYRNPCRSTTPERSLPGARSLVVGARAYRSDAELDDQPAAGSPAGRVCRSAVRDEYVELRKGLTVIADQLRRGGFSARVVADDNALVDRAAAYRAGIGWWGKNTLIILPGHGSWFVLGSVITDAELEHDEGPVQDRCGSCSRCMPACPTGALIAPGVLDARRCLAWVLEAPGPIPPELRKAVGDRVYGCDECQVVCPPNRAAGMRRRRLGSRPHGPSSPDGPSSPNGPSNPPGPSSSHEVPVHIGIARPDLVGMVLASDEELMSRFGHFYLAGRDLDLLRRNALVALGNVGRGEDPNVERALLAGLASEKPLLKEHAAWAAAELGRHDLLAVAGEGQ
jgi:epoxyqueuosine reductase